MGMLQQGFNQALTGATFLMQQTPLYESIKHKQLETKEISAALKGDTDIDVDYGQYKQRARAIGREDLFKTAQHKQSEALKLKLQDAKQEAIEEARANTAQYRSQAESQKSFRDMLKGLQRSDFDELVKRGINPRAAEAGIKQAEKRGEYNGTANTKR